MIAALIRKELRELLPIMVTAGVLQVYFILHAMRVNLHLPIDFLSESPREIPFDDVHSFGFVFPVIVLTAIACGLRQTLWENALGRYQYLLHRPIDRQMIFGVKMAVGSVICFLTGLIPTAVYALWAATPGTHASPFQWSMTVWAWAWCFLLPLIYFGAFLSGLRSARWFGSRIFPFFGASFFAFLLYYFFIAPYLLMTIPALVALPLIYAALWGTILNVANLCDYS